MTFDRIGASAGGGADESRSLEPQRAPARGSLEGRSINIKSMAQEDLLSRLNAIQDEMSSLRDQYASLARTDSTSGVVQNIRQTLRELGTDRENITVELNERTRALLKSRSAVYCLD